MAKQYLDIKGLYPSAWRDTAAGSYAVVRYGGEPAPTPDTPELVRQLRGTEPYDLTIVTGPEGVAGWLGLPHWVRLRVMPDDYDVKERVEPLVAEGIWYGLTKQQAKNLAKKPTSKTQFTHDLLQEKVNALWPVQYQPTDRPFVLPAALPGMGQGAHHIALDFETDAAWKFDAEYTGLAVSDGVSQWFLSGVAAQSAWERVVYNALPVFHGGVFDQAVAMGHRWERPVNFEDTLLLAFCAGEKVDDDAATLGLKVLSKKYRGVEMRELSDFIPAAQLKRQGTVGADPQALAQYAKEDAQATLDLLPILRERTVNPIYRLEKRLVPVVLDMEAAGFHLNDAVLRSVIESAGAGKRGIEEWFRESLAWDPSVVKSKDARSRFNSTPEVSALVYDVLGLRSTFGRSTGKEAMEELKWHPACKRIRAWRKLDSLESEAQALLDQHEQFNGYAHTSFNQAGASTGRFSSLHPINLQNKVEMLREAFDSEDPNECVYRADYAQIELRIGATLSQDQAMLRAIQDGESLHRNLHKMLQEAGVMVSYREVKTFDFALFYGADVVRIMTVLKCSKQQAETVMRAVESAWPQAMAWRKSVIALAYANDGYNESMMGRPFYYPDLQHWDFEIRGHAERTTVNKPIQGTGADIMKSAMLEIPALHKRYGGRLRLTQHDEVAGTIPRDAVEQFAKDLRAVMLEAEPRVPLDVEIGFGENWKDAKPH